MHKLLLVLAIIFLQLETRSQWSTASPQVQIMDTSFPMKSLGRERRICIYLPADYNNSNRRYPVLYMHDGQNLFDNRTSFMGEWGVDEMLDEQRVPYIVVAVDNGGDRRMNEYNPFDNERFGKGEGAAYLEFLVKELKPYVDRHYRTLKKARYTAIAGSSMGGLISFYAGVWYPSTFGQIGVFSPSFWIQPGPDTHAAQALNRRRHGRQQYYFYAGARESQTMVLDMEKVISSLQTVVPPAQIEKRISPIGEHNEMAWRLEMPRFLNWLKKP